MLAQLVRSWIAVVTNPSVATFDAERPRAAMDRVFVGVLLSSFIASVGSAIGQIVWTVLQAGMGAERMEIAAGVMTAFLLPFLGPVFSLIGFFIGNGVLYLLAKLLGGTGDFVVHNYLLSLLYAPLAIIGGVFSIVPVLGGLAGIPLGIYSLVLTTLALRSAHGLSTGRAIAVWAIPLAVVVGLTLCGLIAIIALLAPVMQQMGRF